MRLRELQDKIVDKYENFDDITEHRDVPDVIRDIVLDVVVGMGFHVDATGEIRDPAPRSTIPQQTGVRWNGSRRRRGRR